MICDGRSCITSKQTAEVLAAIAADRLTTEHGLLGGPEYMVAIQRLRAILPERLQAQEGTVASLILAGKSLEAFDLLIATVRAAADEAMGISDADIKRKEER